MHTKDLDKILMRSAGDQGEQNISTSAGISGPLVLIVEDEREIASVLTAYFEREGFRTIEAHDGDTALQHHQMLKPDIVVLDVNLPKRDGFELLALIRQHCDTPVIMATALGDDLDKLSAFRMGVDDYVVKPFNPLELVARVKTILRRGKSATSSILRFETLEIDLDSHLARVVEKDASKRLDLTLTEFRLFAQLMSAPRRTFSRAHLLDTCFSESDAVERTVDSHVSNLRRKLSAAGADNYCATVRGIGYRLVPG
jgi:two-component system response regulator AdeR